MSRLNETRNFLLVVSGNLTVILVMNLKRFIKRDVTGSGPDVERFEALRGSAEYADFLRQLPTRVGSPFELCSDERDLEEKGHQLRIFRRHLISSHFFPAYRLVKENVRIPSPLDEDQEFVSQWTKWDCKLRLSRNGFIVIRLGRQARSEKLIDLALDLSKLEGTSWGKGSHRLANAPQLAMAQPREWQLAIETKLSFRRYLPAVQTDCVADSITKRPFSSKSPISS